MSSRLPLVPLLGALIHLTRTDPAPGGAQDALLATIRAQLKRRPVRIAADTNRLLLDREEVPLSVPGATLLTEQLLLHGIGELELPADPDAHDLLRLAAVLAGFPGPHDGIETVTAALGASAAHFKLLPASLEAELQVRAEHTQRGSPPADDDHLVIERSDADSIALTAPRPEGDSEKLSGGTIAPRRPSLQSVLERGRLAVERGDWNGLLDAGLQLMQEEVEAPSRREADAFRRELRRLIPPEHLGAIARLALSERRQEAVGVLRRFGTAATETLVDLLIGAENLGERRAYYSAITQMGEGAETIVARLDHPLWYVVRNAAELCGDMELADAVPALDRQSHHPDARVRSSVAGALARIGTPPALAALRRMLVDDSATVRRQALTQLGGSRAAELCPAIAALLEGEHDPEVQREALFALARIGAAPAIQALEAWAGPDPSQSVGRPVPVRLLALQALALAGPVASSALSRLTRDPLPEVRDAAARAIAALRP